MADASNSLNKCDVIATMLVKVRSRFFGYTNQHGCHVFVVSFSWEGMELTSHPGGSGSEGSGPGGSGTPSPSMLYTSYSIYIALRFRRYKLGIEIHCFLPPN